MMTVHEVSRQTGVSIRTLQYYDKIGLLKATAYTDAGYRLYDAAALEQLQQILLFRELEFPLKDIKRILASPDFDRHAALAQQVELLLLKKEHIESLISLARGIQSTGEKNMDFSAFDKTSINEYARQVKEKWGHTQAFSEFQQKHSLRTDEAEAALGKGLMEIFTRIGQIRRESPESPSAQALIRELQSYITAHYYNCTNQILMGLGQMYAVGGEFTDNIDSAGGSGTAEFACAAIQAYCSK